MHSRIQFISYQTQNKKSTPTGALVKSVQEAKEVTPTTREPKTPEKNLKGELTEARHVVYQDLEIILDLNLHSNYAISIKQ